MEKLLISACLLGAACRYDGISKAVIAEAELARLKEKYDLVPFCPEIYGGLPTPRVPSERIGGKVIMKNGCDVTENYQKGAYEAVRISEILGIKKALLKERSPSCAKSEIYDGSFEGKLVSGSGVAAEALVNSGVAVFSENDTAEL